MCLFRTVRLYISGIPVEIQEDANRVHNMFELCLSKDHYVLEHTKGVPLQEPYASAAEDIKVSELGEQDICRLMSLIPGNGDGTKLNRVTVTGSFNLGTLQSAMLLPLAHSPITIELELVAGHTDVVQTGIAASQAAGGAADAGGIEEMPRSQAWFIEDPRVNCSLMTLSSSANSEFDKLLSSSGILINAKSYSTLQSSLGAQSENRINFFLSKSNIESIFLTFSGTPTFMPQAADALGGDTAEKQASRIVQAEERLKATYKQVNTFLHPQFFVSDGNGTTAHKESKQPFTVRLSIGSKLLPEHAVRSPAEAMYHLLQALGLTAMRDSVTCAGHGYSRLGHIMAFNTERYSGASEDYDSLGLSTRGAEGIQVQITGNQGGRSDAAALGDQGAAHADPNSAQAKAKLGCLDRCYLTIVSSLKILLKTGVAQVSD